MVRNVKNVILLIKSFFLNLFESILNISQFKFFFLIFLHRPSRKIQFLFEFFFICFFSAIIMFTSISSILRFSSSLFTESTMASDRASRSLLLSSSPLSFIFRAMFGIASSWSFELIPFLFLIFSN